MLSRIIDPLLVVVMLLNFFALGESRLRAAIVLVAAQGALVGFLPLVVHERGGARVFGLAAATILVKGLILPRLLLQAMRDHEIAAEIRPIGSFVFSLLLAAAATALAFPVADRLPLLESDHGNLLVPAALATIASGFLMLVTRRRTVTQTLGYVTLENGIFLIGLLLVEAVPSLVEVGVLLDLFAAVFVMGIVIRQIDRDAGEGDEHLRGLREE